MMIKANELRIGNKLHFYKPLIQEPQTLTVTGIFEEDGVLFVASKEYVPINEEGLKPILLTPEILENMGFEKVEEGFDLSYKIAYTSVFVDRVFELNYLDESTFALIEGNIIVHITYLHQLQNLYFALTGKELEINEPVKQ